MPEDQVANRGWTYDCTICFNCAQVKARQICVAVAAMDGAIGLAKSFETPTHEIDRAWVCGTIARLGGLGARQTYGGQPRRRAAALENIVCPTATVGCGARFG